MTDKYQRWFFTGHYSVSGRPKLEDMMMSYAKEQFLHALVYESFLPKLVEELKEHQDRLYAENKRLKKVDISLSKGYDDGLRWLKIGEQHLTLQRVKYEIDY
jgi:hypothetical protein